MTAFHAALGDNGRSHGEAAGEGKERVSSVKTKRCTSVLRMAACHVQGAPVLADNSRTSFGLRMRAAL